MQRYTVERQLGDGTYGTVYLATCNTSGERVAIKRMKQKLGTWDECLALREVRSLRSLRRLHHPHIVTLREVIREGDGHLALVFEAMEGNLFELMRARGGRFDEPAARSILAQALVALSAMHAAGFFHRDLKPENLLVRGDTVKLADFGLARELRSPGPYTDYIATRWYRAPECLLRSGAYSSPVDVWAMGAIAGELLAGRPLFPGASEADQLWKLCGVLGSPTQQSWPQAGALAARLGLRLPAHPPATPLASLLPHASPDALGLVAALLAWDPSMRSSAARALGHPFFARHMPIPGVLVSGSAAGGGSAGRRATGAGGAGAGGVEAVDSARDSAHNSSVGGLSAAPDGGRHALMATAVASDVCASSSVLTHAPPSTRAPPPPSVVAAAATPACVAVVAAGAGASRAFSTASRRMLECDDVTEALLAALDTCSPAALPAAAGAGTKRPRPLGDVALAVSPRAGAPVGAAVASSASHPLAMPRASGHGHSSGATAARASELDIDALINQLQPQLGGGGVLAALCAPSVASPPQPLLSFAAPLSLGHTLLPWQQQQQQQQHWAPAGGAAASRLFSNNDGATFFGGGGGGAPGGAAQSSSSGLGFAALAQQQQQQQQPAFNFHAPNAPAHAPISHQFHALHGSPPPPVALPRAGSFSDSFRGAAASTADSFRGTAAPAASGAPVGGVAGGGGAAAPSRAFSFNASMHAPASRPPQNALFAAGSGTDAHPAGGGHATLSGFMPAPPQRVAADAAAPRHMSGISSLNTTHMSGIAAALQELGVSAAMGSRRNEWGLGVSPAQASPRPPSASPAPLPWAASFSSDLPLQQQQRQQRDPGLQGSAHGGSGTREFLREFPAGGGAEPGAVATTAARFPFAAAYHGRRSSPAAWQAPAGSHGGPSELAASHGGSCAPWPVPGASAASGAAAVEPRASAFAARFSATTADTATLLPPPPPPHPPPPHAAAQPSRALGTAAAPDGGFFRSLFGARRREL